METYELCIVNHVEGMERDMKDDLISRQAAIDALATENKHTLSDLYQMQSLPLSAKILMTKQRIRWWVDEFGEDGVYVSFSGGKDSTVLLHMARQEFPNLKATYADTGLEFPEIKAFVKTYANVDILKPKMSFPKVVEKYGFPLISKDVSKTVYEVQKYGKDRAKRSYSRFIPDSEYNKKYNGVYSLAKWSFWLENDAPHISHMCCKIMKKEPFKQYEKTTGRFPITGEMASESRLRKMQWMKNGCNAFEAKHKVSKPMSFWTEQDVLLYVREFGEQMMGEKRTWYMQAHQDDMSLDEMEEVFKGEQWKHPICSVYGDIVNDNDVEIKGQMTFDDLGIFGIGRPCLKTTGASRTGCVLCGYGAHLDKPDEQRFLRLAETHPQYIKALYGIKNSGVSYAEAIDWLNEHGGYNIKYKKEGD